MKTKRMLTEVLMVATILLVSCSSMQAMISPGVSGKEAKLIRKNIDSFVTMHKDSFSEITRQENMLVIVYKEQVEPDNFTPELAGKLLGGFAITSKEAGKNDVLIVAFLDGSDQVTAYFIPNRDFQKFLKNKYTTDEFAEKIQKVQTPLPEQQYSQNEE